jgi:predicted dehydrogenase
VLAIAAAEARATTTGAGPRGALGSAGNAGAAYAPGAGSTAAPAADRPSLTVCHVLRYSAFFQAVRRVLAAGELGDVQSIFLAENVAYYHFAHSYVRGNWGNSSSSSPLILAKSCHDLDILCWLAGAPPERVCSSAGLDFFTARNAPDGAPERCCDGCPVARTCLYEAEQMYVRGVPLKRALAAGTGAVARAARLSLRRPRLAALIPGLRRYSVWKEWPTSTVTTDLSEAGIRSALQDGPYGRCVFRCDNDQPDHQDTIVTFANGITAAFRLHGRSYAEGRTFRVDGSRGTLRGRFGSGTVLELHRHGATRPERIPVPEHVLGHSEADARLMDAWTAMVTQRVRGGAGPAAASAGSLETSAAASVVSHLLAFAAHESALTGETQPVFLPSIDGRP